MSMLECEGRKQRTLAKSRGRDLQRWAHRQERKSPLTEWAFSLNAMVAGDGITLTVQGHPISSDVVQGKRYFWLVYWLFLSKAVQ